MNMARDLIDKHNEKHAYLILCHTNFEQLYLLLDLLDDERNDIYLHIDKKSKGYSKEQLHKRLKKSNMYLVKPVKVAWGGSSMIHAELVLLQEAIKKEYQFYHLLSGMDLPLKSQDEIHRFFQQRQGVSFVSLERDAIYNKTKSFMDRINYFFFLQNLTGRNSGRIIGGLIYFERFSLALQKKLKICRTKRLSIDYCKGSQWFSITHEVARYIVDNYKEYKRVFRFSHCADEIFLQTILVNSPLLDTIEDNGLRLIDWERGEPYTFREEDFDLLINPSNKNLFARKFDMRVDKAIIDKLYNYLMVTNRMD